MVLAIVLLLSQAPPADPGELREHMRDLVARLGDHDFESRMAAERGLRALPSNLSAEIAGLGQDSPVFEVRMRVALLIVPDPWPKLLGGTLGEARATLDRLATASPQDRSALIAKLLTDLQGRVPPNIVALLESLLALPGRPAREFALAGLEHHPTGDTFRLIPFLGVEGLGRRAGDALIASGDASIVPAMLDLFSKGGTLAADAARVLEHFGPGSEAHQVAAAIRTDAHLASAGIRILAKGGVQGEDALIGLLAQVPAKGAEIVVALERMGSVSALPVLRAWFKDHPENPMRDRILSTLRDREWAVEKLAEILKDDAEFPGPWFGEIAAAGGSAIREAVLLRLREPGVKVSMLRLLLPLLGAVGRREDGALLVAKLKERRLRDAAAEGLDRMGDPAHASVLFDAFKKSELGGDLHRAAAALSPEALEEDLLEILADPEGYSGRCEVALKLVGRRPTPRLREALFKGILEGGLEWSPLRIAAARILAADVRPEDHPWIERLRAHRGKDFMVRTCGLLCAVRSGDASAMPELAGALSGREGYCAPGSVTSLLDAAEPAGAPWINAVAEVWKAESKWTEGAVWLATRRVSGSQDYLRENRGKLDPFWRPIAEAALAAGGDSEALGRLVDRVREKNFLSAEDERAFLAAAGHELRDRVVAEARGRARFADDPFVRLAALLSRADGIPMYREIVSRDQTDLDWANRSDVLTPRCARALARLKVKDAVGDLRRLLLSRNAGNRAAAAEALGDLGDRAAIPALVRLLDDPFEVKAEGAGIEYPSLPRRRVWDSAMEALERITGVKREGSTRDRRESWKAWYEKDEDRGK